MSSAAETASAGPLAAAPPALQWIVLGALAALVSAGLYRVGMPAAFLIGPMIAAVAAATNGAAVRIPRPLFGAAQALIGTLIAGAVSLDLFMSFLDDWPIITFAVLATVSASSLLGWSISRLGVLPGTTGVWGSAPGASTAMVLMAAAFGADARLVAFMQYLRVLMVTVAAALVSGLWVHGTAAAPAMVWFPPIAWPAFLSTFAVAAAGGLLGRLVRLPSPYFLGAFVVGIALHLSGMVETQVPEWLLVVSYAAVGLSVGLNFDRKVLAHAARALPQIVASILILMAVCGGIAWLLSHVLDVDPLTAYLATSPGGMDSVAIIAAASSSVNLSLIMALQTARFLFVLAFGPALARLIARSLG